MVKLNLVLVFLVILSSCEKKLHDDPPSNSEQNLATVHSSSTTDLVVTPSAPPASISEDLTVTNSAGTEITILTVSEYNDLDPKNQIFYTGLKNAAQYLLQDPANLNSNLQFNADGSYSIAVNSNLPTESSTSFQCTICNRGDAINCITNLVVYMILSRSVVVNATISITLEGCMSITIKGYQSSMPVPDNGGTLVETYTPPPAYSNSEFDNYITTVRFWGASQTGSGPSGGGPISHPQLWSREQLADYIRLFNDDPSHAPIDHQDDDEFQLQLEYYVLYIMTTI